MDNVGMKGAREVNDSELAMVAGGNVWKALEQAFVAAATALGAFAGFMSCGGPCAAGGSLGAGAAAQNLLNNPSGIPSKLAM